MTDVMANAAGLCPWCNRRFRSRSTGGKPQRFCCLSCRRAFDSAVRRWVRNALDRGVLTIDDLKSGRQGTRALALTASSASPVPTGVLLDEIAQKAPRVISAQV